MNNHIIDLTGKKFGRLTVKEFVRSENGNALWNCFCVCGNEKEVLAQHLKRGHVQSCGCLARDNGRKHADKNLRSETAQKNALKRKLEVDAVDGTMKSALTRSLSARNKSGIKGVRWDEKRNKWEASITFQKKLHFLGRFEKKDDAIKARRDAEDKYFKPILDKMN
ncbi:AP2 domain-containing protein [Listeria monocytogenes]|uniref:AP2 domain-containing protein n=1 Tax=Listeria monocytogenes TaxID=1639 RepID=UPI0004D6077E|nr:AP2 domain-containing protein [Listeria monocytogenes]EAC2219509.1 AP2 domain-containing protein [Listeria monocytogenes]EAC2390819.1 AP2 domain-containing protein [Listeria monocytogenes]EAC4402061.1 AP2 domain-containing protein [Listeria monocytogenes]EAC5818777.1 AP2 domain-containing protein [Listeria monocytogenes]EAC7449049.1 AP2 domain-containing protein [Listeria monocytogenes]